MNIGPTGRAGEDAALELLLRNGFEFVARNYQRQCGEIDIIVKNDKYIVFAEVKTRTKASRYSGYYAVTRQKKQKIVKTAFLYMKEYKPLLRPRIDVIDIEGHWLVVDEKEQFAVDKLRWYKNAITASDFDGYI